ncbi:hypothetical protein AWM70_05705 [Paenibacillus yonginensis]|uniref:Uncharacterized protein n=1 Tax=Paenibacillus yonginensis TaxID=1462996 RepID=A0A1B1MY88_9BACL|nr:hypothetical protein AWM70_05705 [Paenibacillus yonginensis]
MPAGYRICSRPAADLLNLRLIFFLKYTILFGIQQYKTTTNRAEDILRTGSLYSLKPLLFHLF